MSEEAKKAILRLVDRQVKSAEAVRDTIEKTAAIIKSEKEVTRRPAG